MEGIAMSRASFFEARFPRRVRSPKSLLVLGALIAGVSLTGPPAARAADTRPIDTGKSTMTVHVYKGGALSVFGHDHDVAAPIAGGSVDTAGRHVDLRVNAAALRVRDPKASEKDRSEIQK